MKKTIGKQSPRKLILRSQTIAIIPLSWSDLRDARVAGGSDAACDSTSKCCSGST